MVDSGATGTGFIDHYIEGALYPERYTGLLQALVGAAVVLSWCGILVRHRAQRAT